MDLFPAARNGVAERNGARQKREGRMGGEKAGKMENSDERKERKKGGKGRGEKEKGAWRVCIFPFFFFCFSSI